FAPAVSEVRKTMKHEHERSTLSLKACLQNIHRQTIDVWDQPRPNAVGKRAVAIGRQVTKICFWDLRPSRRGGTDGQCADARYPRQKLAPRELERGGIVG